MLVFSSPVNGGKSPDLAEQSPLIIVKTLNPSNRLLNNPETHPPFAFPAYSQPR
jgi:hypothetical protein